MNPLVPWSTPTMNPLVSVLCCTSNRRIFRPQMLYYVARQTYRPLELVILDASDGNVEARERAWDYAFERANVTIDDWKVRFLASRTCIGTMRNAALDMAHGEICVHMDDDDWYAADYVEHVVGLLEHADLTGLSDTYFYDVLQRVGYVRPGWGKDLPGGLSMAYRTAYMRSVRFTDDLRSGEDTDLCLRVRKRGDRVNPETKERRWIVYMRHSINTTGRMQVAPLVRTDEIRELMGRDCEFYDGLSELLERGHQPTQQWHVPPNLQAGIRIQRTKPPTTP